MTERTYVDYGPPAFDLELDADYNILVTLIVDKIPEKFQVSSFLFLDLRRLLGIKLGVDHLKMRRASQIQPPNSIPVIVDPVKNILWLDPLAPLRSGYTSLQNTGCLNLVALPNREGFTNANRGTKRDKS